MTTTISFSKATLEAMIEEMERDSSVFLMGEDIAKQGGIFGQYRGLAEKFGTDRVRDFPISEAVLISASIGAALTGGRPVADIHFSDFLGCAMDELTNQAAKLSYMFGGQASVPIVVRAPEGAINSAGSQHSQSLESWFVHTPGWRVVSPSNAAVAKGLLKAAVRCNDPVLFFEHKALYSKRSVVPDGDDFLVPIGKARIAREGSDLTIVSWSLTLGKCLEAADEMRHNGVAAEVIDLRTLSPWDVETVLASVQRTGRLLIVHEAVRSCGLGAEIAAVVAEHGFHLLRAPIRRLANPDLPIPFAPSLERHVLPQLETIVALLKKPFADMDVTVPKLGLTMESALLTAWLVPEGAWVQEGDAIAPISTDKIDHEIGAPSAGVLSDLHPISLENEIAVGSVIARITEERG